MQYHSPTISDKWEIQEEASIIVKVQLYGCHSCPQEKVDLTHLATVYHISISNDLAKSTDYSTETAAVHMELQIPELCCLMRCLEAASKHLIRQQSSLVPRLSQNANMYHVESLVSFVRKHDVIKIGQKQKGNVCTLFNQLHFNARCVCYSMPNS